MKAGGSYSFRCEGSPRRGSGVSWRLPVDATDDLRSRVSLLHRAERRRGGTIHVSELRLRGLRYTDTGTFVCTYNGTGADTSSIDNSTRVHLFVEDPRHLLKLTGVDFFQANENEAGFCVDPFVILFLSFLTVRSVHPRRPPLPADAPRCQRVPLPRREGGRLQEREKHQLRSKGERMG